MHVGFIYFDRTLLGVLIILLVFLALVFAWAWWGYIQDKKRGKP